MEILPKSRNNLGFFTAGIQPSELSLADSALKLANPTFRTYFPGGGCSGVGTDLFAHRPCAKYMTGDKFHKRRCGATGSFLCTFVID